MNLILYKNNAEKNRVDKTEYLNGVLTLGGTLRAESSVINPVLLIELADAINIANSNNIDVTDTDLVEVVYLLVNKIINCNYAYIPDFNRYYFITDIVSINEHLWRIFLSCDVLMSYKDEIKAMTCYIQRNENTYDPEIEDTMMNYENYTETEFTTIDNDLFTDESADNDYYVLTTVANDEAVTSDE